MYNAETGKIRYGKILSRFRDFIEEYGYYMYMGNRKQMWAYNKGKQRDSVCISSDTVKYG